jgi:hypothetical protein
MSVSINSILKAKADQYFISYASSERVKINTSLSHLKANLKRYFQTNTVSLDEFGSFKRGTLLPRNYDIYSDIDLLIVFDHASINVSPSTYRNYLKDFAGYYYPRSVIYKSSPTIVLELDHIKYDLVPAYITKEWYQTESQYFIPQTDNSWMSSDIYGFNNTLTAANTKYGSIVKPIIRLFKAWNAKAGYPYESYKLEQEVAVMNYAGENYQTGFFYAASHLSTFKKSVALTTKVDALRSNIQKVESYLKADNLPVALAWLSHILPE